MTETDGEPTTADAHLDTLLIEGDDRLALDPRSGVNKYLCPPRPVPGLTCFASCTASPISAAGYRAAAAWLRRQGVAPSAGAPLAERVAAAFGVADLAVAVLAASGTDATLRLLQLLAAERPGEPILSILAAADETGSGVPLAAAGRHFAGELAGQPATGIAPGTEAVGIALRAADGTARAPDAVSAEFAAAAAGCRGRAVIHRIDGSKTGLVAPARVPDGAEVVVDACQARLPPARLRGYLGRGWPVVVTGSKFYGGPAFSGAVLLPRTRLPPGLAPVPAGGGLATSVRWVAALAEMEAMAALPAADTAERAAAAGRAIADWIGATPGLAAVDMPAAPPDATEPCTIFAVTVDDPGALGQPLSVAALRPLHQQLARQGVLLGQPVRLGGQAGALRIALGARNLLAPDLFPSLDRLFQTLARTLASAR